MSPNGDSKNPRVYVPIMYRPDTGIFYMFVAGIWICRPAKGVRYILYCLLTQTICWLM